jgi:hypothetical protein
MSDETQIRIRCLITTRKKWKKICADFSSQEDALIFLMKNYRSSEDPVIERDVKPGF